MTSHYLNPVVPQNYTNNGTTGDFSAGYERDLSDSDRLSFSVRHELARFLIPNELVQEQAGQIQSGDNFETMGTVNFQHIFSAESLGTLAGMVRNNANDLYSNEYRARLACPNGLAGVRKAAREQKEMQFTALLHHLTVALLRDSFYALKRKAAPGVDGVTWREYETGMEDRKRPRNAPVGC